MVLTDTQKIFLDWLDNHPFSKLIYWTWWTALAYRYNHRLSTDLDFFSHDLLADYQILPFISEIKTHFWVHEVSSQKIYNRAIFFFDHTLWNLKIEFTYFPFAQIQWGSIWNNHLKIDSPFDIGVNKIHAVTERQEVKDVYDLYEICIRENIYLWELVQNVEKKFGVQLEVRDIIARIAYIARDIDTIIPFLLSWNTTDKVKKWVDSLI